MVLSLLFLGCQPPQEANCRTGYSIYTQDVLHFRQAYGSLQNGIDTAGLFQTIVLDKATEPFKQFIKRNNCTAKNYASQTRRHPKFYTSIRSNFLKLIEADKEIRSLVQRFRTIYSGLEDADFCIAFGNFYTGGTSYVNGKTRTVYIGLAYHGPDSAADVSEFNETLKAYLSRSNFSERSFMNWFTFSRQLMDEK